MTYFIPQMAFHHSAVAQASVLPEHILDVPRQTLAHHLFTYISSYICLGLSTGVQVTFCFLSPSHLKSFFLFFLHCLLSTSSVSSGGSGITKPSVIL